jgi:hypothetical protein
LPTLYCKTTTENLRLSQRTTKTKNYIFAYVLVLIIITVGMKIEQLVRWEQIQQQQQGLFICAPVFVDQCGM